MANNKLKNFMVGYVVMIGLLVSFGLARSVYAETPTHITNELPVPGEFTQGTDVYMETSRVGRGNGLDAKFSRVKIYSPSPTATVTIINPHQCNNTDSDYYTKVRYRLFSTNAGENRTGTEQSAFNSIDKGAGACPNVTMTATGSVLSGLEGHTSYYVYIFEAQKNAGGGVNAFKLLAPVGSFVGYYADGNSQFALQARSGTGKGDFSLRFSPSCDWSETGEYHDISWFDADQGGIQRAADFGWEMHDETGGGDILMGSLKGSGTIADPRPGKPAVSLGGNGSARTYGGFKFQKNHKYNWKWTRVRSANGIQFVTPFDSVNRELPCGNVIIPSTAVQGRVYSLPSRTGYPGVTVDLCGGGTVTTAADGSFFKDLPVGTAYCVKITGGGPPGLPSDGPFIRPLGVAGPGDFEGYPAPPSCSAYLVSDSVAPNHCTQTQYDSQVSGGPLNSNPDRTIDSGFDFVYTSPPPGSSNTCTNISTNPSDPEPGVPLSMSVLLNVSGTLSGGVTAAIRFNGTTGASQSVPDPLTNSTFTVSGTFGAVSAAGDYDVYLQLSGGNVGANNSLYCGKLEVANKPYFRAFSGDVVAGAIGFDPLANCPGWNGLTAGSSGSIFGFSNGSGKGAGTQLVSQALGVIDGFSSAQGTSSPAPGPDGGLSFANTTGTYGGSFGPGTCPTDFWKDKDRIDPAAITTIPGGSLNLNPINNTASPTILVPPLGTLTIGPGIQTIQTGNIIVVYVDGDVVIQKDIKYQTGSRTNVKDIPSLTIVAYGNVYIDKDVTNIDAVLVAQPNVTTGTGGTIFTCSNGSNAPDPAFMADQCNTQLTVTGALVANTLKLFRSYGTLKDASNNEQYNTSSQSAERIIYSPEFWIRPNRVKGPASLGEYDDITSLPPVF